MRRLGVWPPLSPRSYVGRAEPRLPFPLEDERCMLFTRARNALIAGLDAVGIEPESEILMPLYHHGSEIEAVRHAGARLAFYRIDAELRPLEDELGRLVTSRTTALYLIHYLGYPQDVARWRRWCDDRGLLLIEDAAQAWPGTVERGPLGSWGNIAVFCFYKTYGTPLISGVVSTPPATPARRRARGAVGIVANHRAWLVQRVGLPGRFRRSTVGYDFHADVAVCPSQRPSWSARFLLRRLASSETARRRRSNALYLMERLEGELEMLLPAPVPGASPFALPVVVPDKQSFLSALAASGVVGLDFWSTPHPAVPQDEAISRLRSRVVGLPVHQELRRADLDRVVSASRAAAGSLRKV